MRLVGPEVRRRAPSAAAGRPGRIRHDSQPNRLSRRPGARGASARRSGGSGPSWRPSPRLSRARARARHVARGHACLAAPLAWPAVSPRPRLGLRSHPSFPAGAHPAWDTPDPTRQPIAILPGTPPSSSSCPRVGSGPEWGSLAAGPAGSMVASWCLCTDPGPQREGIRLLQTASLQQENRAASAPVARYSTTAAMRIRASTMTAPSGRAMTRLRAGCPGPVGRERPVTLPKGRDRYVLYLLTPVTTRPTRCVPSPSEGT